MQIPAGLLLDNIGPRRPLTAACFLCFFGCVIFGTGKNIYMLSVGRILMGIGSSFGFLTAIRIASTWFRAEKLGLFIGLSFMFGTLGGISGSRPLGILLTLVSWQNCMLILATFSAVLGITGWITIRDEVSKQKKSKNSFSFTHIIFSIVDITQNPQTWIYALYGFLMYVPLSGFADLWGTSFIAQKFNIDHVTASGCVFSFYLGAGIGAPLWPLFSTWIRSYKTAMISSALLTALFISIVLYQHNMTFVQSCFILGMAGAFSSGQFLAFSGVVNINPRDRSATASGVHNMICMFSGNLIQPLLGYFLQKSWSERKGNLLEGVPDYTLEDFSFALAVIPVSLVVAAFSILFIKETFSEKIVLETQTA